MSGGVMAVTDDSCCELSAPCNYAVYPVCEQSEPKDNHVVAGDTAWTDYRYQVRLKNSDDDALGFVESAMDA